VTDLARLFGEFLVNKNLVSAAQVLEALMIQIRDLPTYAEICYEKKLLSDDQLLRVLADQQRTGKDFRSAAEHAGIWSESIGSKVEEHLRTRHRPVGEVLIELGHLNLATLTTALDEYVGELSGNKRSDDVRPESAKSFDPDLLQQFLSSYSSGAKIELEKINTTLESSEDTHAVILLVTRQLIAEVSGVKGAAEYIGADTLAGVAETVLSTMRQAVENSNYAHHTELENIAKATYHVFEACVQSIAEFGTDDVFAFDTNMADLRGRLYRELTRLAGKLGFGTEAA
jgi:hypothetical protein